ncbi:MULTISPECIES: sensor histidine kinase [Sphingobacterium]|uniref:sensor histidine kinase n=1 Tax=Sphingobacterium TaxID=28453 RepID=UPI0013DCEE09|nr:MULTISPECIES: HAMP domain-containing sensor histidine kinase [unclassified Sphingobacterium]
MAVSLKYYTNRFIIVAILVVMAVWALLFYAILMDEVYDNIDDGLKNQKIEIIREAYDNPIILDNTKEFGINQFRILPIEKSEEDLDKNHFSKELIYMPYDEEDEPYRVLRTGFYSKEGKPYSLEIRTSTVEEDDYLINLAISLGVLYLVIILSILIINHFVLSRAWRPFRLTLDNLSSYRFGDTASFNIIRTNVKEFEELNREVKHMIDRNEAVFESQKLFLENASHELQTPLAVTINKLELLMDDSNLTEEQLVKIADAKAALHRMVGLNRSLLMLSRIDNNQYASIEFVDFGALVRSIVEELTDMADHKGVLISINEKAAFRLNFNMNLARILLSNLLRNGLKYNVKDGEVMVDITADKIYIANDSNSGALNPDYIFERFYKGSQDNNSNGLGLSIVRSILEKQHQLKLLYSYESGKHFFILQKIL